MPPLEHGFLGPEADKTRQQILHKYAALFTLLRDLNDVCHEYLGKSKYRDGEGAEVFAISYFMRGLMTFQSLLILSEYGCIEDIRALCRTLLQACFRLAAIAVDPTVINRILASAIDLDRKRLKLFKSGALKIPPGAAAVDFDAKIAEKDAEIQKLGGSLTNDQELAAIGGRLGDYPAYLVLPPRSHS
jgi:Family of unknown function (DUF5677)